MATHSSAMALLLKKTVKKWNSREHCITGTLTELDRHLGEKVGRGASCLLGVLLQ